MTLTRSRLNNDFRPEFGNYINNHNMIKLILISIYTVEPSPVAVVQPQQTGQAITKEQMERIHQKVVEYRRNREKSNAAYKVLKRRLLSAFRAKMLIRRGLKKTLMDETWAYSQHRKEKWFQVTLANDRKVMEWYKLFKGYTGGPNQKKTFEPDVNYWQEDYEYHKHSVDHHCPSEAVRFMHQLYQDNHTIDLSLVRPEWQCLFIEPKPIYPPEFGYGKKRRFHGIF